MKKLLVILSILSFNAFANWQLQTENSAITFVSTKQLHIREVHQLQTFEVAITSDQNVSIKMDLSSIESGIPIRNQRMREMLFDVSNFRYATLAFQLPETLTSISKATRFTLDGQLTLKDKQTTIQLDMLLAPGSEQITATLLKPVLLSAQQVGLDKGVDALREIAGLTSIGYSVPVSATMVLQKIN